MPSRVWRRSREKAESRTENKIESASPRSATETTPVVAPMSSEIDQRPVVAMEAPAHPVPQLQGPFGESMTEAHNAYIEEDEIPLDAATRRNMLLDAPTYQRVIAGRWKRKPGEKYHPLWKLVAQMSFGVHLLAENMARSEEDVFQILQTHVDDIDIFLERTTEDFTLAQDDIQERLKCLRLPLQHPEVFDKMLEDRAFRNSIVEGNEKIEHIVTRTGSAMKDALKDVQKGFDSTNTLEKYLTGLDITWVRNTPEHEAVLVAMLGNVEGWKRAFLELHTQGNKLAGALRKLTEVVNQMQQRAGEVSRRLVRQARHGANVSATNNITYISSQNPSRSSSRQHQPRRPLQAPSISTLRTAHSRMTSVDESRADTRADTRQSERTGTGLSVRSHSDLRAETPLSRAGTRAETSPAHQESARSTPGGGPRLVYVRNNGGHLRINSQTTPTQQRQPLTPHTESAEDQLVADDDDGNSHDKPALPQLQIKTRNIGATPVATTAPRTLPLQLSAQTSRTVVPVELPAALPPAAFLQAPVSKSNRLSVAGVLPSERKRARDATSSKIYNPANALIELLNDPSRLSRIPDPTATTDAAVPSLPSNALAMLEGTMHLAPLPLQLSSKGSVSGQGSSNNGDGSEVSVPGTPSWASRTFDDAERHRILDEKIPFRSHPPTEQPGSPPLHGKPTLQTMASRQNMSASTERPKYVDSNLQRIPSSAPAELPTGYEGMISRPFRRNAEDTDMLIDTPGTATVNKKKMSFVAELEGSRPVLLQPSVYTPRSARSATSDSHELDASDTGHFTLPIQSNADYEGTSHTSSISELSNPAHLQPGRTDTDNSLPSGTQQVQVQLEEAIRKSITDADIAIPPSISKHAVEPDAEIADSSDVLTPRAEAPNPLFSAKSVKSIGSPHPPSSYTSPKLTPQQITDLDNCDRESQKRVTAIHAPLPDTASPPIPQGATFEPAATTPTQSADDSLKKQAENDDSVHLSIENEPPQRVSSPLITVTDSENVVAEDSRPTTKDESLKEEITRQPSSPGSVVSLIKVGPPQVNGVNSARPSGGSSMAVVPPIMSSMSSTSTESRPRTPSRMPKISNLREAVSAPGTELKRSNTKDTRKQWKAFFTGQLKSSLSKRISKTDNLLPSIKLRRGSQQKPGVEAEPKLEPTPEQKDPMAPAPALQPTYVPRLSPIGSVNEKSPVTPVEMRPPLVELRQNSSSALGFQDSFQGLGLLAASTDDQKPRQADEATTPESEAKQVTNAFWKSVQPPVKMASPRIIEVKRKAVGSGIARRSTAATSQKSAASKDQVDNSTSLKTGQQSGASTMMSNSNVTNVSSPIQENATVVSQEPSTSQSVASAENREWGVQRSGGALGGAKYTGGAENWKDIEKDVVATSTDRETAVKAHSRGNSSGDHYDDFLDAYTD